MTVFLTSAAAFATVGVVSYIIIRERSLLIALALVVLAIAPVVVVVALILEFYRPEAWGAIALELARMLAAVPSQLTGAYLGVLLGAYFGLKTVLARRRAR